MKPRRTLLVVINKKVEWGILSVADIAVKWVNFRLHRSGSPRGRSWPPATLVDFAVPHDNAKISAVALDNNPARNRPIAIATFKAANVSAPTGGTPRLSTSMRVSRSFAAPSPNAVANVMIPSRISTGPRAVDRLS
jgi:hypothetical protein